MNCGNDCERKKNLKDCLIQLDALFQWLAAVENKSIEKYGAEMGSNFAKFKIYPEYIEFIQPACEAEKEFSAERYPQCAERCRNSMQMLMKYLYAEFGWPKPIGCIKHNEPSLDQLLRDETANNFLTSKGAQKHTYSKKYGNDATHQPFYDTDINDAYKSLKDLFYLITKSLSGDVSEKNKFAGTQRFDISLLANSPKELIKPQLKIEVNGNEKKIPQNVLLKSVYSNKITEDLIKENLSLINKTDVLGNTPLSLAVYNDDFDTVKLLLENGADPNFYFSKDFFVSVKEEISKDKVKYTCVFSEYIEAHRCIPLIVAIKKDSVDIVKLLLQYGAKTWDTCIDDWYNVAKLPPECSTLLGSAFFYNAKKCIRFLLNNDIGDVNEETKSGVTPLLLAVENGVYVEKLLSKGAKIDSLDKYRNSVFLHAVQNMRHDDELLEKLLEKAKTDLNDDSFKKLLNHAGLAGCPISYMDKDEAELFLEYGADINAKNDMGVPCVVDVAHLNPGLLPWFKDHGAKFDLRALFGRSSYLAIKYTPVRAREYRGKFFTEVLKASSEHNLLDSDDLNFTVPIDNLPRISPLVDAILFTEAKKVQDCIEYGNEKTNKNSNKVFLTDSQISELKKRHSFFNVLSKYGMKFSSYAEIESSFNRIVEGVKEGWPYSDSQKELTIEEVKKLPKRKLNITMDMTLEEVNHAIASIKELSRKQKLALFEKHPFIKQLKMQGIDYNIPEEVESAYNNDKLIQETSGLKETLEMSTSEIIEAVREIKAEIPYEDVKISPLDDALIAENYEAAAIYLSKGIQVSELTKILLLSVHDVSDECAWNNVLFALRTRKDIDFSDVLITLCKNHPKEDFDIAEEFINNGHNFYRFANFVLPDFNLEGHFVGFKTSDFDYDVKNRDSSIENVRERNNSSFLRNFGEKSFQDVNLRLIKNAIAFGADISFKDESGKSVIDYAKENSIDEYLVHSGSIVKLRYDNNDKTKIFRGQIEANGKFYNFDKVLFDKNHQEVGYKPLYKGRTVTFHILQEPAGINPGLADQVTLTDD